MRPSSGRRLIGGGFWAIIATAAALIITSGFAYGAFVLGSFNVNPLQSSAGGTPNAPPGMAYVLAEAQLVNLTSVPAAGGCLVTNLGTLVAPTILTDGTPTAICLNYFLAGFTSADEMYVFEVTWGTLAAVSTIFEIQIGVDVTPSANDVVATSYVQTSATITTTDEAVFALDLTQASDLSLVQFNVLATQL